MLVAINQVLANQDHGGEEVHSVSSYAKSYVDVCGGPHRAQKNLDDDLVASKEHR